MRRSWIKLAALGLPVGLAIGLVPAARRALFPPPSTPLDVSEGPIAKVSNLPTPPREAPKVRGPVNLATLDTTKLAVAAGGETVTAPLEGDRVARLTLQPELQRMTREVMRAHSVPEAAVVLMDVETGKVLVYASHVQSGPARDLCVEATAPAASVFKVVTGSALVESAHLTPEHRECYSGGEHRVTAADLERNPKRDRWCTTLAGAMGKSANTIFARLALEKLPPKELEQTARALGFGGALPFDVPLQPSGLELPDEPLKYARTAAGFWNTTLSPVHAAWLSATVARGGVPVRPSLVAEVLEEDGKVAWTAPVGVTQPRAVDEKTARAVSTMMEATVTEGTSYRAFRDGAGRSFLPGVSVAGKTGTLTDGAAGRFYTWFTGFAPSRPYVLPQGADKSGAPRQVAIGVLVVNDATWSIKANTLAREVLRGYFASQGTPQVSPPKTGGSRSPERAAARKNGRGKSPAQPSTTPGTKQRRQRGS